MPKLHRKHECCVCTRCELSADVAKLTIAIIITRWNCGTLYNTDDSQHINTNALQLCGRGVT